MFKKKSLFLIIILFIFIESTNLLASDKSKIIDNLNKTQDIKFDFIQISFDKKESGFCFLKRPHFLKCIYNDENQKELIINRKNLVIHHKKYNKTYFYPISKSYFVEILDKEKFKNLIFEGNISLNEKTFEIKYFTEKGEITFFFEKNTYDLLGWKIVDINGNSTSFKISNIKTNQNLERGIFSIPEIN